MTSAPGVVSGPSPVLREFETLHIEHRDGRWATWVSSDGGPAIHSSISEALDRLLDAAMAARGFTAIVTTDVTVRDLAVMLEAACGAPVCEPYDARTEVLSRRCIDHTRLLPQMLTACDASVRSAGRAAVAAATFDGEQVTVWGRRIGDLNSHAAELAGILLTAARLPSGPPGQGHRIVCDSADAVRRASSLHRADEGEIGAFCARELGVKGLRRCGPSVLDGARRIATAPETGQITVQWVRGHDDAGSSIEHELNVVVDQTARALSLPGKVTMEDRLHARACAEAIIAARIPTARFQGAGLLEVGEDGACAA